MIQERAALRLYTHNCELSSRLVSASIKKRALTDRSQKKWDEEWVQSPKAPWTHQLFPFHRTHLEADLQLDFWIDQAFTGHDCFGSQAVTFLQIGSPRGVLRTCIPGLSQACQRSVNSSNFYPCRRAFLLPPESRPQAEGWEASLEMAGAVRLSHRPNISRLYGSVKSQAQGLCLLWPSYVFILRLLGFPVRFTLKFVF